MNFFLGLIMERERQWFGQKSVVPKMQSQATDSDRGGAKMADVMNWRKMLTN